MNSKGYKIALDWAFSSPDLYRRLHAEKFNVVGTIMPRRKGMPEDLKTIELKPGETVSRSADLGVSSSLWAMVWRDKWYIRMLSTMHTAEIRGSSKKDRTGAEKQKLACIPITTP